MPNYTKTIQLEKPLQTETYDVDKRNANWDKIDAAITEDRDSADKHSKNPSAHANGIAGNAGSATKLKTARQITLSGNVSGSAYFDGSKNITINVNRVTDAEKLTNSRQITLSGDVNGSAYFDGSSNININVNSRHSAHASNANNAGYANWANGANALAGNEALYNYLHRHNNTTIPKTNAEINKLGIFARYFAGWGQINNQPTEWGQLINFPAGMDSDESCQLWLQQDNGKLWHRGGNSVTPVNNRQFVRFLDTEDISGNVSNPNAWWVKLGGKFPLIIQGGLNVGGQTFYFPIAFPNAVLSVQGVIHNNGGKLLWLPILEVDTVTKEKASIWSDYGGRTWLAIGY